MIDVLSLAPLDEETILESVRRTHRLVVVDEDNPVASMARDIAAIVADKAFDWLDAPIKTVTAPNTPVPFAAVLESEYIPNAAEGRYGGSRAAWIGAPGGPADRNAQFRNVHGGRHLDGMERSRAERRVEAGEAVLEIETEKAVEEVEAPASGVLHHVSTQERDCKCSQ